MDVLSSRFSVVRKISRASDRETGNWELLS